MSTPKDRHTHFGFYRSDEAFKVKAKFKVTSMALPEGVKAHLKQTAKFKAFAIRLSPHKYNQNHRYDVLKIKTNNRYEFCGFCTLL